MRFSCSRERLLNGVLAVQPAVNPKSPKPILTCVKFTASGDTIQLLATNLDVSISTTIFLDGPVDDGGEAVIPAAKLVQILREINDETVSIDADERRAQIHAAFAEFEIPSEDPDGFPDGSESSKGLVRHTLSVPDLRKLIDLTTFCASRQDTKYCLTGICLEFGSNEVTGVGTDTRRLSVCKVPSRGEDIGKGKQTLVPATALSMVSKLLAKDADAEVTIDVSESRVVFSGEKFSLVSRLLDGRYPPYREIIPKSGDITVNLPVAAFESAVRQAAIMSDDDTKRVDLSFEPGKVVLRAQGATTGRSSVQLALDYDGKPLAVRFDPAYLIDLLASVDGEETIVGHLDEKKPSKFLLGDGYLHLIMPMTA